MSYDNLGGVKSSPIPKSEATIIVKNVTEFIYALQTPGQKIYLVNSLNLTGFRMLAIPENTTIFSNGKLIRNLQFYPYSRGEALLFTTTGSNIRISGIQFQGCNAEILDQDYAFTGYQGLIKVSHSNFQMDNCYIYNYDTWGVWLNHGPDAHIFENTFSNIRRSGYGYSIWVGGTPVPSPINIFIERNIFLNTRHAIGSSGHLHSWHASYNLIDGTAANHNFDRHNDTLACFGGADCLISNNIFLTKNRHFGIQRPISGAVQIESNYFFQALDNVGTICDTLAHLTSYPEITFTSNNYQATSYPISLPVLVSLPPLPIPDFQQLRFIYKDSYIGKKFNKYKIQVLHNNSILWRQDIRGNGRTWNVCQIPVPSSGELKIRFICLDPTEVKSVILWIDDIQLKDNLTTFENKEFGIWEQRLTPKPVDADQVSSGIRTDDARSGYYSYSISFDAGKKYNPGQYCELYTTLS